MKLTRKQFDELCFIATKLRNGMDYLAKPTVHVAKECDIPCGDTSYTNAAGKTIVSIDKFMGSDLCEFQWAQRFLQDFIDANNPYRKES